MDNDINTIVVDEAFGEILLSAVRYTLGRQTHIVSSTTKYVQSLIPKLDSHTIACMERDIRTAGNYGSDTIDKPEWMRLLNALQQEMQNRNIKPW